MPFLHHPEDSRLFQAETQKTFLPVETCLVAGDFLPSGWYRDNVGWKGLLKRFLVISRTRRESFLPQAGRQPLIATDRFSNGYFHWVTETLPRLWWLKDQLIHFELLLPAFAQRFSYMEESLALFPDLAVRTIDSRTRWRLEEALLVPAVAPGGNYRPLLVKELGDAWRRKVPAKAPFRKLYISRSRAARRRITKEAEVIKVLEARGFETVHLEGRTFSDQVQLLAETSHLLSNHGAGLTNMLFMLPGTKVTEIRLRGDCHNNCYFSLARALDLDYDYRLGDPADSRGAHRGDLLVDAEGLL